MANKQTIYTRDYRIRLRKHARAWRILREKAFDHPELIPHIKDAEAQAEAMDRGHDK